VFYKAGFWVYPFMSALNSFGRAVFFVVAVILAAFLYKLGEYLNAILWNQNNTINKKQTKSNKD
jgi:hypothetical protein